VSESFYITTPIYYVNDSPHLGHAYTTVAADVITRYRRLMGQDAFFLTGVDEHGQKVMRAAAARGLTPQAHCDDLAEPYQALWARLSIQYDDFIRTTEPRHQQVVQQILQRLYDEGQIYKQSYEGWYSTSAEKFWTEKDLVDGKCPDSGQSVEWISEENYFFKMSAYKQQLIDTIEQNPDFIRPSSRRNEVLGYLKKELGDLCISRPKARMNWGIELPFDADYVTYVWFDALVNYISAIGYTVDEGRFQHHWPASFHLVGKDILTTHSVYWSTMLFALGLPVAECLYAHGWWTVEGQKMSKSIGNVVDPHLLIDAYGADAVRYFLMREIAFGADGDFSHRAFQLRYNAELVNDLGNLAHRSLSMTERWLGSQMPGRPAPTTSDVALESMAREVCQQFAQAMETLQFKEAYGVLNELVNAGNKYVDTEEPWALNREGRRDRLETVLRNSLEICRICAVLLSPVCPTKAAELLAKLGIEGTPNTESIWRFDGLETGAAVAAGDPLFPRMRELPEVIQQALEAMETAPKPPKKKKKKEKAVTEEATETTPLIEYDDFVKVALRAGHVQTAEKHPKADRLLVLTVDVGETEARTIVAGLAEVFSPEDLVGRRVVVVTNLAPRKLRGVESQGMILAAGGGQIEGLVELPESVMPGAVIR